MRQHMRFCMVAIAMAMALTMCVAAPKSAVTGPTDLGVLDGFTNSMAVAANASGQVVGACYNDMMGETRAFLWLPEAAYGLAAGMHDLGVIDGSVSSYAIGINSQGQVIGVSWGMTGRPHAFLWLPEAAYGLEAGLNTLNGLDGEVESFARDINDAGQIVGVSGIDIGEDWPERRGFIWQNGVATALTMANGSPIYPEGDSSGRCLTETGQVIGRYEDSETSPYEWFIERAVLWDNGTATALTPVGVYSEAIAINSHGEVVGRYEESSDVFLWLPEAAYGLEAGCHLLADEAELFVSNQIFVHGISDAGQILGRNSKGNHMVPDESGEGEGTWVEDPGFLWVWQNGAFQQLATMDAYDVEFDMNAAGQAAGFIGEPIWDEEWNWLGTIQHGYFWSDATGLLTLPTLGGDEIQVRGIGPDGLAVGGSSLVDNTALHACTWGATAPPPPSSCLDISDARVTRRSKSVAVHVTLTNSNATPAANAVFTTATLGGTAASGSMKIGTIKAGASKVCTLQFRNVPAGAASLLLEGTCSLGDFSRTQTVTVP